MSPLKYSQPLGEFCSQDASLIKICKWCVFWKSWCNLSLVSAFDRPRKGGITVVPRRAVAMCSPSAAPTVPVVSPRTRPSRSLWSGTLWRQRLWETSRRPVSLTVGSQHLPHGLPQPSSHVNVLVNLCPLCCSVCAAQALREAALLCQLCHPQ